MEIWKDIPGFNGRYQASTLGNLRKWTNSRGFPLNEPKLLSPGIFGKRKTKYRRTLLIFNGKIKALFVHRLVALTFIPNPNGYLEINHKDGNGLNNTVENLEWCTMSENMRHRLLHLSHNGRKLNAEKRQMAFDLLSKGWPQRKIAEELKVNQSQISRLKNKEQWNYA